MFAFIELKYSASPAIEMIASKTIKAAVVRIIENDFVLLG